MPVSTRKHLEALRAADQRALTIKQEADEKALELSREAQKYRDEQANKLREQINQERNLYATKDDLTSAIEKVEAGRNSGRLNSRTFAVTAAGVCVGFIGIVVAVLANAGVFGG
jgi:predicted  nucleic acid-binding Zn-ribbon protein